MAGRGIHQQLLADCHHFGKLAVCEVLLNRNASLPWFILVPDTELQDVLDLPADLGGKILAECTAISAFIKSSLGYSKVNYAGLGNVVPQMHLHIIGRSETDACWPQPVWGALPEGESYDRATLRQWQSDLVSQVGLHAVTLDA